MGQNSSSFGISGDAVSPRNKTKPPRPTEPPKIPKIPNYVVPENKVIPNGAGDPESARKLLRPVSQELSKFHSDFADIFPYDPEKDFLASGGNSSLENSLNGFVSGKENSAPGLSSTSSRLSDLVNQNNNTNKSLPNGKAKVLNNQISSRSMDDLLDGGKGKETNLKRTHSFQTDRINETKVLGHKRQASLTNSISIQQPVIHEDPREHLYNVTRQEPFSNLMPGAASLPLKNSYQSDYSLNLTYAQLAEHRRQQRYLDLENRTGQRLKDLGVEISATSTVPKSPFDRANLGAKSATSSVSTGSSDHGVSKSKKKKAPAPPPPPPPNAEPPADYDMGDLTLEKFLLTRRNSSASRNLRAPAPDPYSKRMSVPVITPLDKKHFAAKDASVNSSQDSLLPQIPPPPPPPPLPPTLLSPASSYPKSIDDDIKENHIVAKAQLEMLKKMEAMLKESISDANQNNKNAGENVSDLNNNPTEKENGDVAANTLFNKDKEEIRIPITSASSVGETKDSPKQLAKKMSSLLQHDIILAANAQAAKTKKKKTPPTLEKPKDAAQIFREELQKAALEREQRQKESWDFNDPTNESESNTNDQSAWSTTDDTLNKIQSKTPRENSNARGPVEELDRGQESPAISQYTDESQPSSSHCEEMSISSNNSQKIYSPSWTPEDDLDPDDDIVHAMGRVQGKQAIESAGFKTSMIPMKIKDLKDAKSKKTNKNKYEKRRDSAALADEKAKVGSIRRFKKSVHESVRNMFGSIGKASGKLAKKHKSQDFVRSFDSAIVQPTTLTVYQPDVDESDNWELASEGDSSSMRRSRSEDFLQNSYLNGDIANGFSDDSGDDDEIGDIDFASGINGYENHETNDHVDGKDKSPLRKMKRAGVAYVSGTGQIIVLPEYNTVNVDEKGNVVDDDDDGGRAPKLFKKKEKKLQYESTLRQQERNRREEMVGREIREKETQIEMERFRQQEIEKDFRRLRDLEEQEKLQKLQTERILERLTLLQQHQFHQVRDDISSTASLNHLPLQPSVPYVNGGHNIPNYPRALLTNSNLPQSQSYTHLPGSIPGQAHISNVPTLTNSFLPHMSTTVNASHYTTHSAPIISNTPLAANLPNLSTQELTYLSGYMQMMGIAPPSTQQQWAFLLSSVNINAPGFPGLNQNLQNNANRNGPDFSQLFGGGKTLERTVVDSNPFLGLVPNNSTNNLVIQPTGNLSNQKNIVLSQIPRSSQDDTTRLMELDSKSNSSESSAQSNDIPNNAEHSQTLPVENGKTTLETNNPVTSSQRTNTTTTTRSSVDSSLLTYSNSPEKRIDLLTSKSHPASSGGTLDNTVQIQNGANEHLLEPLFSPFSSRLPPKVYGPIGFKPVSFKAGAT